MPVRSTVVASVLLALALGGCAAAPTAPLAAHTVASPSTAAPSASPGRTGSGDVVPPAVSRVPPPPGPGWTPVPELVQGQPPAYTSQPDPRTWALWMDPHLLSFRFVPGYRFPEHSPVRPIDLQPSTWVPRMIAAFNGGFKLSDHVGGYFYAGTTEVPLRPGLAAFVIGEDGSLRVVVWGRDVSSTAGLLVVRENLKPLVDHGMSMTRPTDRLTTWGLPYRYILRSNRSALAELANGSLVYVYVHDALPSELAAAAIRLGAVTAIALDMNTGWPAALLYRHDGGRIVATRLSPVMKQHLDAYYARNQKEFIAVEPRP